MESIFIKNLFKKIRALKGYTLLELLVVLAIIGILAVIIVLGQGNFNSTTLLTDTTYTVALSIRETQTLGISTREFSSVANAGYGIHFGDSSNSYIQFADIYPAVGSESNTLSYCPHPVADNGTPAERPGNCTYDSAQNEEVQQYSFSNGYSIKNIYYFTTTAPNAPVLLDTSNQTIDILYERPNNQAVMTVSSGTNIVTPLSQVLIDITSPQGGTRCVYVTQLGQIYESTNCS